LDSTKIIHMFASLNQAIMKKLRIIVLGICIIGLFHACRFGQRHTTIVENGNGHYLKIEFSGNIEFNSNETAIAHISRYGYVKVHYNDHKLEAENDGHGGVRYKLYDGDQQLDPNGDGKALIAEAVKQIISKVGHDPNRR
jgi:hypothetical protein